jgi:hypothetical protein
MSITGDVEQCAPGESLQPANHRRRRQRLRHSCGVVNPVRHNRKDVTQVPRHGALDQSHHFPGQQVREAIQQHIVQGAGTGGSSQTERRAIRKLSACAIVRPARPAPAINIRCRKGGNVKMAT